MRIELGNPASLILALERMSFAISARPVVPELRCVRMSITAGGLDLYGTTGHLSYSQTVNLDGDLEGTEMVLVDHALLLAALQTMHGAIELYTTKTNLIVRAKDDHKVRSQIRLAVVENHPEDIRITGPTFTVDAKTVKMLVDLLQFAVTREGSRPELAGILFGPMSMSGDGTRLVGYSTEAIESALTVPTQALQPLRSLAESEETAEFTVGARWVQCCFGGTSILKFARLAQEFPGVVGDSLTTIRSRTPEAWFVLDARLAHRTLNALNVYSELAAKQGISYCTMQKEGERVYVSVDAPTAGSFTNELTLVEAGPGDFSVLFSAQAMLDVLSNAGEKAHVAIFSDREPMLITNPDDDRWAVIQGVMAKSEHVAAEEEDF